MVWVIQMDMNNQLSRIRKLTWMDVENWTLTLYFFLIFDSVTLILSSYFYF